MPLRISDVKFSKAQQRPLSEERVAVALAGLGSQGYERADW